MNKVSKTLCFIAAGMIAFGVALAGFGFLLGANTGIPIGPWDRYYGRYDSDRYYSSADMVQKTEQLESFSSIDLDLAYQEVEINQGNAFSIHYSYNKKYSDLTCSVEDGVLKVKEIKKKELKGIDWDLWHGRNKGGEVIITYPKGTEFGDVSIVSDMSSVEVEGMRAQNFTVTAAMGEIDLTSVHVASLELTAAMGAITMDDCSSDTTVLDCKMGSIEADNYRSTTKFQAEAAMGGMELSGDFRGETYIKCDMGGVSMELEGSRKEYSYNLKASLGGVEVDGDDEAEHVRNDSGDNYLEVKASMGGVEVNFNN